MLNFIKSISFYFGLCEISCAIKEESCRRRFEREVARVEWNVERRQNFFIIESAKSCWGHYRKSLFNLRLHPNGFFWVSPMFTDPHPRQTACSGQSYKDSMLVNYDSRVESISNLPVIYDSRVVIYERNMFIRLATDLRQILNLPCPRSLGWMGEQLVVNISWSVAPPLLP